MDRERHFWRLWKEYKEKVIEDVVNVTLES